jgi:hypothetical protein
MRGFEAKTVYTIVFLAGAFGWVISIYGKCKGGVLPPFDKFRVRMTTKVKKL